MHEIVDYKMKIIQKFILIIPIKDDMANNQVNRRNAHSEQHNRKTNSAQIKKANESV